MYKDEPKPPKGGGKKKGAAESVKQQRKDLVDDIPVDEVAGAGKGKKHPKKNHKKVVARKKGGAKKDVMMDENMSGSGKKKGAANYEEGYPPAGSGKKKGASKKKGAADFPETGTKKHMATVVHSKSPSGEVTHDGAKKPGAGRMGFTQNFGPARQNSYARGAAKVAQIMGKGAFKKKGAADHEVGKPPHPPSSSTSISQGESDRIFTPPIKKDENANTNAFIEQGNNYGNRLDFSQSPTEVLNRAVNIYSNSEDDFIKNSQGYGYGNQNLSKFQLKSLYGKYKDPNYKQKRS